jgi:hypothetical protein
MMFLMPSTTETISKSKRVHLSHQHDRSKPVTMVETNKFAHAEYLGIAYPTEPEIVIIDEPSAPGFAETTVVATPVRAPTTVEAKPLPPVSARRTTRVVFPPVPDRFIMKQRRKRRTVAAGVIGGTIGLIFLGPIGAIGLGVGSALVAKHSGKARERDAQRRYEASLCLSMRAQHVPAKLGAPTANPEIRRN